jgi:glycosyltransferase involved in cell wall biosynthesis
MKILHVVKKYPNALGGDAVVVENLQKQQQNDGHTTAIVTSNCAEIPKQPHLYKVGLKSTPAQLDAITFKRLLSLLMLLARMFMIIPRERPDVIHTHSVDMAFFASFAARLFRVPVVHTFHIVTFYDKNQSILRRKTEIWLTKKAKVSFATAPNNYDVQKLQTAGLKQALLLPNGVDLPFWAASTHSRQTDVFTFLAVGRLEDQKGYKYLIKAVRLLLDANTISFRVMIVGEGSQKTKLRKLARSLQVNSCISFSGRKSTQEVRDLLAQADAVVLPSLYETTPITLLEAWAASVPVIITSVGILRDTPKNFRAAYIVPPKDVHALMDTMRSCMVNAKERSTIAAKGYKEAQKYTWPLIAQTAEAIYREAE